MKPILKRLMPCLLLAFAMVMPAMAQNKIATIDLRTVFDKYWKRQQAQTSLNERGASLDKELKGFMDDYKKLQEDYNKLVAAANDQGVTTEERDKRKAAAEAKLRDIEDSKRSIQTFEENARDQIDSQKKRMRESILADIRAAINAKAKAAGYTMVFDTAADSFNQTPILLYTNGENDITEAILAQLSVNAPPPSSGDTPKTDDTTTTGGKTGDKK
jgi:Skp family chaperone for outer membrane proteins